MTLRSEKMLAMVSRTGLPERPARWGDQPAVDEGQQLVGLPVSARPGGPAQVAVEDVFVRFTRERRFRLPDGLLGVEEAQEEQPGQVLDILHHPAAVVVAAQDVARSPDIVGQRLAAPG